MPPRQVALYGTVFLIMHHSASRVSLFSEQLSTRGRQQMITAAVNSPSRGDSGGAPLIGCHGRRSPGLGERIDSGWDQADSFIDRQAYAAVTPSAVPLRSGNAPHWSTRRQAKTRCRAVARFGHPVCLAGSVAKPLPARCVVERAWSAVVCSGVIASKMWN